MGGNASGRRALPPQFDALALELAQNSARIVLPQRPNYAALFMVSVGPAKRPITTIRLFTTLTFPICNSFAAPEQWLRCREPISRGRV
jgi:hypothetical protein